MEIAFLGAVREVTGSMHLLSIGSDRILLDCGMFQGRRADSNARNRNLPVDPSRITSVVLSHAHIDHSGRLPMLTRENFSGRIVCTRATAHACEYLLADAAHIQESDADYLNYKTVRRFLYEIKRPSDGRHLNRKEMKAIKKLLKQDRHRINRASIAELIARHNLEAVQPLYTVEQAQDAQGYLDGYPYRHPVTIGRQTQCTLYDAGHILGSAVSIIKAHANGRAYTVGFTGDLGRFGKPILKDPTLQFESADRQLDLLIMESTYGDRQHAPVVDLKPHLKRVIEETAARGGSVLIPSFAFGRTQELLYTLHTLYDEGQLNPLPVYVDSPLATRLTRVFAEHPEVYDRDTHRTFLENGANPFAFKQIRFVASVEESMALNREEKPHVVIAASGMCEAGRILHHLRHKIHNPKHTVLIVGYMARHTLGRRIQEMAEAYEAQGPRGPAPVLRILNKEYPLQARVVKLGGFSAHADREELTRFLETSNLQIRKIAVVHGEEDQSLAFADHLRARGFDAMVPEIGEKLQLD